MIIRAQNPATRQKGEEQALATEHLLADLGQHTAYGSLIAVAAQVVKLAISLLSMAVMARLLYPTDFGLVAMAVSVTSFIGLFTDLGLSSATVQRKEIDEDTVSALFYINLAVGIILVLGTAAIAPVAAQFYGDERVYWLIIALALQFPIAAAAAQHNALLQRGMRWVSIQWTTIAAQLTGALIGIMLAWKSELGYWSLVAQSWATALTGLLLAWIVCPWRPGRVNRWGNARSALTFGLNLTGFSLLNYLHRQLDNALVGWRWGAEELGYYSRAYALFLIPLTAVTWPVSTTVVPAMSRLQSDAESWKRLYLTAISCVYLVTAPLSGLLFIFAEPLVWITLGDNWAGVVPVFKALAVSILMQPLYTSAGWIFISLGRTADKFKGGLFITIWYVFAYLIGVNGGALGVAVAYTVASYILVPIWIWWATRGTNLSLYIITKVIAPQCVATLLACATYYSFSAVNTENQMPFLINFIVFILSYFAVAFIGYIFNPELRLSLEPVRIAVIEFVRHWRPTSALR